MNGQTPKSKISKWFEDRTTWLVEIIGSILALVVVIWWVNWPPIGFVSPSAFALLATLPGLMAFAYHCISSMPRFRARLDVVRDYGKFTQGFDTWWLNHGWPRKLQMAGYPPGQTNHDFSRSRCICGDEDYLSFRPMFSGALWGALLLTMVFLIAVGVAEEGPALLLGKLKSTDGIQGFLFAAMGAYVSVMWRMINRIHANALTYRFVFTATLRSALAMAIGYVAARVQLFGETGPAVALFFMVGLFTDWALSELRNRARAMFKQNNAACDRLPLCLIDGLDDGMIDILDELGIWDVEHLATSEPAELTIRTLYPFNRVIDWIDQAILVMYLRRNIGAAREHGITGAIDLAVLYGYILDPERTASFDRANKILDEMSKRMALSREVIDSIAQALYFDYTVEQLYRFWQRHREVVAEEQAPAATPA